MIATHHEVVIAGLPSMLPRLWRYGLVLARNPETAEDLVQTTCVRALEKSSQFEIGTRLDRWLFAILRSIWINQIRGNSVAGLCRGAYLSGGRGGAHGCRSGQS